MRLTFNGYELILQRIPPPPEPLPVIDENGPKMAKPKKQSRPRIRKCPVMDKRMFTREQAAAERDQIRKPNIRIYCCEFCNAWHLTHKKFINR
jgi:hypothetical protein